MAKKIKIDFLSLYRSRWKYIFFLPIIVFFTFIFYKFGFFREYKFGQWQVVFHYGDMLIMGLSFLLGVRSVQEIEDLELTLPLSKTKAVLARYFSNLLFVGLIIVFIFLFLLISGFVLGLSGAYIFNVILNVVLIDILAFNFSIILGMVIGRLIKSKLAYLFVIFLLLFFTPIFSESMLFRLRIYDLGLWKSLSFLDDNINYVFFTSLGNVYDKTYFLDKLVPLVFSLFLLAILVLSFNKKKTKYLLLSLGLLILSGFSLKLAMDKTYKINPQTYNISSVEDGEKYLETLKDPIEIKSYKMDIELGENFSNTCEIEILNNGDKPLEEFSLFLNSGFSVVEASLDGEKISTRRDGENLILEGFVLDSGQKTIFNISYSGHIKDIINPGILLNYSSNSSSNILPGMTWYPFIKIEEEIPYEVQVSYKKKLLTNLNDFEILDQGVSNLRGKTRYLYISDGFYAEKKENGWTYVGSEEVINHYLSDYDGTIKYYIENTATNKELKKIIIFPDSGGFELDNALMISEF